MKTIEEKAEEFASREYEVNREDYEALRKGYYHGAKEALASQWRSVDDALPEDNRMVIVHISDINFIPDLSYCMAYYENGAWNFPDDYYYDCKVTHWMPIPKLNK